ncbi:MAG: zinc ABC transporter substrate-binding protein, partial [Celeribacter marinus]
DEHDNHDDHDHGAGADDPHMWLDPENAKVWMQAIARTLAEKDPENAVQYEANANAGIAEIDAAIVRISKELEPLHDLRFIVFHDAYHYFEARFGVEAVGAVSMSDASAPSPKRIAQLQDAVERSGVTCAFSEPQYNSQLVDTVLGKSVGARAIIDPLGAHIEAGPQFYIALLDHITQAFVSCQ